MSNIQSQYEGLFAPGVSGQTLLGVLRYLRRVLLDQQMRLST